MQKSYYFGNRCVFLRYIAFVFMACGFIAKSAGMHFYIFTRLLKIPAIQNAGESMKTQKQRIFSILAILTMTVILTCIFAACDKTNVDDEKHTKQVPVYKGMTISDSFAGTSATVASDDNGNHYGHFKGDHNDRDDEVDQNKPFEDPNAPSIENKANSTLDVVGAAESIYYADKNQDIFITIRLSNPDSYEILSFTLNGKKYSNYMFEEGSDMENLVLKVNVGNVGGIHDYTIDAIKYVDGTDIKDVRMDGDRTVKAGVRASDQTYVNVTNEQKSMTSISFDAQVVDLYSLIEKSGGYAKAVLYDGVNMLTKDIKVGEKTNIVFDNLTPNTVYQYGVVALYDNLSGNGAKLNTLYKKAVYTDTIVLFKDVQVGKESIEWGFVWNESFANKQMNAISLWQNDEKVQDVDVTATRLDGLKTDNEYTLKATYNNLQNQEETISIEFVTCAKAVPTVEIMNVQSTQTAITFELNVTDTDNVGAITKIELLHGNDEPIVADTSDVRTFENLLSNNDYTVKVTYTYDLNDGVGEQQIVKTADVKTKAKAVPTVEITNVQSTQTEISFGLNITDTDNVGAITKIELLHGDDEPIVASDLTSRSFENLLSNNDYTVKVTYTYDLNDGAGKQQIVKTADIKTKAKATPSVTIDNFSNTINQISADVTFEDIDSIGEIINIVLKKDDVQVAITNDRTSIIFDALDSDTEYTIVVEYKYNLNDGNGEQTATQTARRYTSPVFEFVEATCANTSAVIKGDVIYFEAIINNPSGVTVEQVKINDRYYAPSAGTTRNSVIVNINVEDQFEGGNTDLVVTEIKGILHGQKVSFSIKNDNNVSVFVNGDFTVKGIKVVDENNDEPVDAVFMDKEYYYLVQIGNKTGYNIDSITISGVVFYAKDIEVIDNSLLKIRIETKYGKNKYGNITAVEYHNDYVGNKSKNIQSAQNFVYECFSNSIPIEINNIEELLAMVQHGYYVLGSDIVFSGTEWMPTTSFDGYLDGQNHSIKGLNCAKTFEDVDIEWGLFKKVSGIVKNLKLYGRAIITITSTDNLIRNALIGGLSARVGDVSIIDIENHISIALSGYGNIGGIIGMDINSTYPDVKMTNCVNYGSISGDVAGGIVGAGFGFVITGCINYGDITGGTIGGISGNGGDIVNCVNDAVVRGRGYVGGIVGAMGNVTQCINKGDIYGETYVGGIGGYQIGISNSINRGTVTSENIAGGILAFGEGVSISNVINEGTIIGGAVAGGLIGKAYCHDHGFINTINDSYNSGEIRCSTGLEYGPVVGVLIGTLNNEQCFYITAVEGNEIGEQKTLEEIIEIMKTKWDQNIWDFDNLDENGNPTLK